MAEPTKLTRAEIFARFDVNEATRTILDKNTNLMWMVELVSGSWSTHSDGEDRPDGSLFSQGIYEANLNPTDKVLQPARISHSETGKFVDDYDVKTVTLPGEGEAKPYTDWRLPDVHEMVEFQTYYSYIWNDDFKGESPNDSYGVIVQGKTYQSYRYFWTSTLLRKHDSDVSEHRAWAVAETEKVPEETPRIIAEEPTGRTQAIRPILKPVVDHFATTEVFGARLVRDAGAG